MGPGSVGAAGLRCVIAAHGSAEWLEQYNWDSLWEQIDGRYGEAPRSAVEHPCEEPAR